jgi:hypothetical protein
MREPSGLKTALCTLVASVRVKSVDPVFTSHIRAVPSHEAVTTRLLSGLNAAPSRWSVCPESVVSAAPVLASHNRAVLS